MAAIIVLGSLNMDIAALGPRLPQPGETLLGAGATAISLRMEWPHQLPGISNRQLRNEINRGGDLMGGKFFAA